MSIPGAFGGLLRYSEEYTSKIMLKPIYIILFIILIHRGFQIARQSDDDFAKLLAIGIITWLALQIFINIGGMIKLMPLTGVPLPFMSLGGSNLAVTLIAVGILTNISKFTHNRS